MTVQVTRLDAPFGVAIEGLNVQSGVSNPDFRTLLDALYAHRLIVIKRQQCDRDAYLAFGKRFGTPLRHVLDHIRMPGYPDMLVLGNTEAKDRDERVRNGAAFWHTDQSYTAHPVSFTMLYSLESPREGGETLIADMVAAYEALDTTIQARIADLIVVHQRGAANRSGQEHETTPFKDAQQAAKVPPVSHPLVRHHPATGQPVLYAVAGTAARIEGMADDEATQLLEQLKRHATSPSFVYARKHEVGDIAIYDTDATMHSATPIGVAVSEGNARKIWRISVHGPPNG